MKKHLDWLYRLKSEIFVFMPTEWIIPMVNALDMAIKALEQDPKPIDYYDCSSAMLKLWMENIVTDSEYYRIVDKLNAKHKEGKI